MATPVFQKISGQPKRAILQLRVDQFIDCLQDDFEEAIEKYLVVSGRPTSEIHAGRHFIHIEPFQGDNVPLKYFHIVLDLEQRMQLFKMNSPLAAENLLGKIRPYTDELYPWGRTRV
ncbi:hypothetical protein BDV26DRAFT_285032 [Aspergillus bertholletiae]|uniref:Uncharacterized protein n=1 Tax=Aspergillus bertholletiae TaxID=1226010 RepID=A0A5N7AUP6_9EURO|nr:hypothetical protein BDV26DRAFT_285032 [Aspergillus bertholletiae]